MQANSQYDIYIVGLGIVQVDQITRETERAISSSKEILYVERGLAVDTFLRERCEVVTDLTQLYHDETDRLDTYRRMAASVIAAALDHSPVTFALYGHPLIFAYPPFLVQQMARCFDLTVKILPAISAMDCIFADLAVDPSMNGLQIFEATEMLLRGRPLQVDVPVLIWQIGSLETGLYSGRQSRPERFDRFLEHVLAFYPATHTVFAVHSSTHPLLRSEVIEFKIGEIGSHSSKLHAGFSLYIPPLMTRPVADWKLAGDMSDLEHLRRITMP